MRGLLGHVVQRVERGAAVLALQCGEQYAVAEGGVLGQDRPVAVGAEGVQVPRALGAVGAVVAVAAYDPAQRLHALAEPGAAGVVLKADDGAELRLKGEVAYHALGRADRLKVQRAQEVEALARVRLVAVTHQLVAAADAQEGLAVGHGGLDVRALAAAQIVQQQALLEVLAAADEEDVVLAQRPALAQRQLGDGAAYAAPGQALLHTQDIAPVAVEVQHVGVKVADLKLHHFQNSFLPTREASSARSGSMAV